VVELGGCLNIRSGNFEITDFSVNRIGHALFVLSKPGGGMSHKEGIGTKRKR
jgi:hypothetical protein